MNEKLEMSELEANLAAIVDGEPEALERFGDAIADDDELRDAKHEAELAAERVAQAGDDFESFDVEDRLLAAIDAEQESSKPVAELASEADQGTPSSGSRRWLWTLAPVAAAAGITAMVMSGGSDEHEAPVGDSGWSAKIEVETGGAVSRADGGRKLATDGRTRARLALSDGSTVILAPSSSLRLLADNRQLELEAGSAVFEVAEGQGTFRVGVDGGVVEVLGTRFAVTEDRGDVSVKVLRGKVRLASDGGGQVIVEPGQEGLLSAGKVEVMAAYGVADSLSWTELEPEVEQAGGSSLGELRAKKPGDKGDERPLTLADHKVKVRVVGNVARTEVEQTFRNDTAHTLEGIYSFPLPVDAQIERLQLDVEDGFEEGAFVDRERAAKIWAGVIHNATPRQKREKNIEMIWVPGPWRDPALLEWQKGGRFELRIFPIPGNGQRTIKLAYTQTLAPFGRKRRYVYPMAHSSDGSTAADRIGFDIRVAGAAKSSVRAHGYQLEREDQGEAVGFGFEQQQFSPSGDLIVDYALPGESALSYWSFVGEAAAGPGEVAKAALDAKTRRIQRAAGKGAAPDPRVSATQAQLAADPRGYVLFALRPTLPAWTEHTPRDLAIVVDSSQSMVGERYQRAIRVVRSVVAEMDRRDRVSIYACDLDCRAMTDGLVRPNRASADKVAQSLADHRPAGSSNLMAALSSVAERLPRDAGRKREVLYVGDGVSSVGHRRASTLAAATEALRERTDVAFSTLGIGSDSDSRVLAAVAQAGGGHHRAFVPGERSSRAAMAVLESLYGSRLTNAKIELPAGLEDVVPSRLPNLHSGEEVLIAARMSEGVPGKIRLRGLVAGKSFEQSFDIDVKTTTSKGNAFVPRVWASLRVADLENRGRAEDRAMIVGLSKAYAVLSRHTSLLVLESKSMFSAFGVDRSRPQVTWSGEDEAVVSQHGGFGDGEMASDSGVLGGLVGTTGAGGGGVVRGKGGGMAKSRGPRPTTATKTSRERSRNKGEKSDRKSADKSDPLDGLLLETESKPRAARRRRRPALGRRGGYWAQRVRTTVARISPSAPGNSEAAVDAARASLDQQPDSRDRHRLYVRALSYAGQLEEAERAAEAWLVRDQLDAEALTYLSDAIGRQGRRQEALRILSGIVDLDPDREVLHQRLIKAYRRAGRTNAACGHQVALAEVGDAKAEAIGAGARCLRVLGRAKQAARLVDSVASGKLRVQAEAAASRPEPAARTRGAFTVKASWDRDVDLDLSIVTPQGTRLSWMGGRKRVIADRAHSRAGELLGLTRATPGTYVLEVSRTGEGAQSGPVSGELMINAHGRRQRLRFNLEGERAVVGSVRVWREWRTVR